MDGAQEEELSASETDDLDALEMNLTAPYPAAARPDRFLDAEGRPLGFFDAVVGGRSVGVPGVVALLAETHRRHGKLPWAKLFVTAIDLADNGFQVSHRLNALLSNQRFLENL